MMVPENEVIDTVKSCLYDMHGLEKSLPIPGGSDWAGSLPRMYETFKTKDFSMVPGRGVFGHPNGPEGGARSLREAWDAIEQGKSLEEYSKNHPDLKAALTFFGTVKG